MAEIANDRKLIDIGGSKDDGGTVPAPAIQAPTSNATTLAGDPVSTKRFIDKPSQFYAITSSGQLHRVDQPGGIEVTRERSLLGQVSWKIQGENEPTPPSGFDKTANWKIFVCRQSGGGVSRLIDSVRDFFGLDLANPSYLVMSAKLFGGIKLEPGDRIIFAQKSSGSTGTAMKYSSFRFGQSSNSHIISPSNEIIAGDIDSQIFKQLHAFNLPLKLGFWGTLLAGNNRPR